MIKTADTGALFRAPDSIRAAHPEVPACDTYAELLAKIRKFAQP